MALRVWTVVQAHAAEFTHNNTGLQKVEETNRVFNRMSLFWFQIL